MNASIQRGRPAQIHLLAKSFHSAGQSAAAADDAFAQARERFEKAWGSDRPEQPITDSSHRLLAVHSLGAQSAKLPETASRLELVARALTESQRGSATCLSVLERRLKRTDNDLGDFIELQEGRYVTDHERCLIGLEIQSLDQRAVENTKAALREVVHIRDAYVVILRRAEANLAREDRFPSFVRVLDAAPPHRVNEPALPIPAPDSDPVAVNKWWNSLSSKQRSGLIEQHLPELGNLNGVPVAVRNEINQAVMNDDVDRVRDSANRHRVSVDEVLSHAGRYGLSATDVCRYNNGFRTQEGLIASAHAEDEHGRSPEVFLFKYQPEAFGGDGAAAIAMGNPDTAPNTAVLVKGMGSGVRQGTLANPDGRRLFHESNCADWGKDTAVLMWVGYDAPNGPLDSGLYEPNLARAGGRALAADVNSLTVTHQGEPAHIAVVGHSYGSTTVSDAAAASAMRVHDVVLLGCPGTDLASSAADFHLLPGGHLFVGDASQDEVSWFGHDTMRTPFGGVGLGPDPAMDGYGATRFKAEVPGCSTNLFYDHSHYFDDGSESLFSLGDIVSGHGDELQRDHMTARHRGEYRLPALVEPEAARGPTTEHRHSAPPG